MGSSIIINNKSVSVPKDFFDVGVKASFGEDIQANLTTEEFTFILDAYEEILSWINQGKGSGVGIFEGISISITKSSNENSVGVFNGIIDLQAGATIQENLKQIKVRLRQDENLNQLSDLIEPLDFGYLRSIGVINQSDYTNVDYVVVKPDTSLESITLLVTVYLLSKQLADTVKELGETIATISGILAAGVSGSVGAAIYSVAVAILQVAYAATLLVLIIDFGTKLFDILNPPKRTHKGISLKTLLAKTCEHIGFGFETTITDLENLVYLPSNQNTDEFGADSIIRKVGVITEGIPNPSDPGYTCTDMFQICRNLFNARFAIVGSNVQFHSENSDYWISQSGWEKPNVVQDNAERAYRYNTDEIKSSMLIQFQTDIQDQYTIENYKGTSYQVLTDAKSTINPVNKTIKNVDRVDIPFSLGNRKDNLTSFEEGLASIANLFDEIARVFGGNLNLTNKIKNKIGILKVSNNNHTVPKLLWMSGTRLPSNQRNLLSAKALYDKYHNEKSFIANNFGRQRRYVESERIPFGLSDFVTLLNNSYFRDENGKEGKIVDIEWLMSKDYAVINYWTQEIYTRNLQETFIEPE